MALLSWRVVPAWALSTARIATQRACAPSGLMTPCPRISSPVPYSQPRAVLGMQAVVAFGKVSWQQCAVVAIAKPGVRRCQATTFHHGAHIGRWPRPTYDTDDDARSRACSLSSQSQSAGRTLIWGRTKAASTLSQTPRPNLIWNIPRVPCPGIAWAASRRTWSHGYMVEATRSFQEGPMQRDCRD
jgi:hypothetical protein